LQHSPLPTPIAALFALAAVSFTFSPAPVLAGARTSYVDPQGYAYYDIWWREQRSAEDTALLLHFGQPQEHPWSQPGNAKVSSEEPPAEQQAIEDAFSGLDDLSSDGGNPFGSMRNNMSQRKQKQLEHRDGRPRSDVAPPGKVYDYSPNRRVIELPEYARIVEDGKFGSALKLTGQGGVEVRIGDAGGLRTLDGWFRPKQLPDEPVCLVSSITGDVTLMLLPDGRIRFHWRHPRERSEQFTLTSDKAIKPGVWTHVSAYTRLQKHIEGRSNRYWVRLGINGEVVAELKRDEHYTKAWPLVPRRRLIIGANPDGGQTYTGLVDDLRVAHVRRYHVKNALAWRDPSGEKPVPFGPPHFTEDTRVFHASFESPRMAVHPPGHPKIRWDLGEYASFSDMQVPGIHGKGLLIDPAFDLPRIPIQGFSIKEGTFELWIQPVNWDNHTDFGKISWHKHTMSVARFMGRDKKTGKVVPFMEFTLTRATIHGVHDWIHPGTWYHFIWTWSPEDVYKKDLVWGKNPPKKGDPISNFKAHREGYRWWKSELRRDVDLLDRIEPLYLELGINDDITVYHGQRPAIMVDEVIGHAKAFTEAKRDLAPKRWSGELGADRQ
jgi:hypothetical protein